MADPPAAGPAVGSIVVARHAFAARSADELSFGRHDRIEVLETDDQFHDSWFLGRHLTSSAVGLFPYTYMEQPGKPLADQTVVSSTSGSTIGTSASATSRNRYRRSRQMTSGSIDGIGFSGPMVAPNRSSHLPYPTTGPEVAMPVAPSSQFSQIHSHLRLSTHRQLSFSADTDSIEPRSESDTRSVSPTHPTGSGSFSPMNNEARQSSVVASMAALRQSQAIEADMTVDQTIEDINHHLSSFGAVFAASRSGSVASSDYGSGATDEDDAEAGDELTAIPFGALGRQSEPLLTRQVVGAWTADQVARHLETVGVPVEACVVFRQQEISGDVLLSLDRDTLLQPSVLELGPVGSRLRIWNKICAFRDELDVTAAAAAAGEADRAVDDSIIRLGSDRLSEPFSSASARPLSGSFAFPPSSGRHHSRLSGSSSSHSFRPIPAAASVPVTPGHGHSRGPSFVHNRHSSFGSPPSVGAGPLHGRHPSSYAAHFRQSSIDHAVAGPSFSRIRATTNPPIAARQASTQFDPMNGPYNRPMTRSDAGGSASLYDGDDSQLSAATGTAADFSRTSYGTDNTSDRSSFVDGVEMTRSSKPVSHLTKPTPIVTNLEESGVTGPRACVPGVSGRGGDGWHLRIPGFRAFSDSSSHDKRMTGSAGRKASQLQSQEGSPTSPTGGRTLEVASKSSGSYLSAGTGGSHGSLLPRRQGRKKGTSAFVHGLLEKTPAEQMEDCNYSGWMLKRSTKLIGTWKTRLFILRGRRLSYYYADSDQAEKGLIDISSHQVLPATNERLVGFHASLSQLPTGHSRASSGSGVTDGPDGVDRTDGSKPDSSLFVFKLVPPRSGFTRTVNFTKPTVHYFAVQSVAAGRAWMAALMKANIELVESSIYSTFNHRTIPLRQAQLMALEPASTEPSTVPASRAGMNPSRVALNRLSRNPAPAPGPDGAGLEDGADRSGSAASSKVDSAASGLSGLRREKMESGHHHRVSVPAQ